MAGRTVESPGERECMKHLSRLSVIVAGLIVCMSAFGRSVCGQPISDEPSQWKQRIERPHKGWDYDGERILGHLGYDICLWDATTGKLLHRMKEHQEYIHAVQFSPDGHYALR